MTNTLVLHWNNGVELKPAVVAGAPKETAPKKSILERLGFKKPDKDYQNAKLAFIVGHEQVAPGAYGVDPLSEYEYSWSTKLARLVASEALKKGVQCRVFYRDGIGIKGAYKNVRDWGADATVESHFNAANLKARGTETLVGKLVGSSEFGGIVHKHIIEALERPKELDRGLKVLSVKDRGGINVNQVRNSCLIEPFFGDNKEDAALGASKRVEIAQAILAAFLEYTRS